MSDGLQAYAGVIVAGAFLLPVRAQRVIGPSRTAIILSAEPVFTATASAESVSDAH